MDLKLSMLLKKKKKGARNKDRYSYTFRIVLKCFVSSNFAKTVYNKIKLQSSVQHFSLKLNSVWDY